MKVNVEDSIHKPVQEVFEAIINPGKLDKYFVSSASDALEEGKRIEWAFADVGANLYVQVKEVVNNQRIRFKWVATGKPTNVTITLADLENNKTKVAIIEEAFSYSDEDIKNALQQTQGWTDFICSLKAYLYAGINIRYGGSKAE